MGSDWRRIRRADCRRPRSRKSDRRDQAPRFAVSLPPIRGVQPSILICCRCLPGGPQRHTIPSKKTRRRQCPSRLRNDNTSLHSLPVSRKHSSVLGTVFWHYTCTTGRLTAPERARTLNKLILGAQFAWFLALLAKVSVGV